MNINKMAAILILSVVGIAFAGFIFSVYYAFSVKQDQPTLRKRTFVLVNRFDKPSETYEATIVNFNHGVVFVTLTDGTVLKTNTTNVIVYEGVTK